MLHSSAAEHFKKLRKVFKRVEEALHKDDLDDFFKTAYHLLEITEKDKATTPLQKSAAAALRQDIDFQVCRDIANSEKHFGLDPKRNPTPAIVAAPVLEGYGVGRFGKGGFGVGEQSVSLLLSDGTTQDALGLVRRVFKKWFSVFG